MADPGFATQKAIYTALETAFASISPTVGVYDHVPEDSDYPFVSIDSQEVVAADYLTERKDERFLYLTVWSRHRGQKEVNEIIATIDAALHRKQLSMEEGAMIESTVIRKRTALDADGVTYMGRVTVRVLTEH